jgi:hypothetical protein
MAFLRRMAVAACVAIAGTAFVMSAMVLWDGPEGALLGQLVAFDADLLGRVGERSLQLFLTVLVILLVVDFARRSATRRRARQTVRPPRRRRR